MIAGLGPDNFQRGEAIYSRVCANCHGTKDQPGSLPTAPRFASATLKNGGDPYTHVSHAHRRFRPDGGADLDGPPAEVRRHPLHPRGVPQAGRTRRSTPRVDRAYLDRLPKGTTPGPGPRDRALGRDGLRAEPDGDTAKSATTARTSPTRGSPSGSTPGRGACLGEKPGCSSNTTRSALSAAWTGQGFIDWNSINFNGRHQVHPRVVGKARVANPNGPGWANPADRSSTTPGLAVETADLTAPCHAPGHTTRGSTVTATRILAYTVGTTDVLESPGLEIDPAHSDDPIFTRTLEIGPSPMT